MSDSGIKTVLLGDEIYPELLKHIYNPPKLLYYKGSLKAHEINMVAIVGSRKCSLYGIRTAERLAFDLAKEGMTIVSGMAEGIDQAAHRGALKAGGRTIAVMGSGFKHIYPSGAEKLVELISDSGAVITEYPLSMMPLKHNFPKRNRIISGMSKGIVVVEAGLRSGALITARLALEENREVFSVPGCADSFTSSGTNMLIQNGAKLVTNAIEILEEICQKRNV